MVVGPFITTGQARSLDAPNTVAGGVATGCYPPAGLLHFVTKGMEYTQHQHGVGAAVDTGVDTGSDLLGALCHPGVGEYQGAPFLQYRGKLPFLGFDQLGPGTFQAEGGMFLGILMRNINAQLIEIHGRVPSHIFFDDPHARIIHGVVHHTEGAYQCDIS